MHVHPRSMHRRDPMPKHLSHIASDSKFSRRGARPPLVNSGNDRDRSPEAGARGEALLEDLVVLRPARGNKPQRLKQHAEEQVEQVLDALDLIGRNPDTWESRELLYAVKAIEIGMYTQACECAAYALLPPGRREPFVSDYPAETTAQIRAQLALARQMRVRH